MERNESIHQFFDRASLVVSSTPASQPVRPDASNVRSFLALQKQTQALHRSFQVSWPCACASGHAYAITVQKGPAREGLVAKDASWIKLLFSAEPPRQFRVEIESMEDREHDEATPASTVPRHEDITALREQLSLKEKLKNLRNRKGSRDMSGMSPTTSPADVAPSGWRRLSRKSSSIFRRGSNSDDSRLSSTVTLSNPGPPPKT
jgi:hypothetical protein